MQEVHTNYFDEAPLLKVMLSLEALDTYVTRYFGLYGYKNKYVRYLGHGRFVAGGDFRQILPVIPQAKRPEIVQACINSADEELPVMLLRNLNPSQGLCNGTRLIITDVGQFVIHAKILTGSHIGDEVGNDIMEKDKIKAKKPNRQNRARERKERERKVKSKPKVNKKSKSNQVKVNPGKWI
ncbi:ATP-dependent DNA helicase PIF1-like protein [Tanacetum coccineum]